MYTSRSLGVAELWYIALSHSISKYILKGRLDEEEKEEKAPGTIQKLEGAWHLVSHFGVHHDVSKENFETREPLRKPLEKAPFFKSHF